jgi:hypothetical protein
MERRQTCRNKTAEITTEDKMMNDGDEVRMKHGTVSMLRSDRMLLSYMGLQTVCCVDMKGLEDLTYMLHTSL